MKRVHTFDERGAYEPDDCPRDPVPCPTCRQPIDDEYHFGIYVTRVSYLSFCSKFCAIVFDFSEEDDE